MKFVMDTSKYWFKPSITREQGERKHYVSGDEGSRNQVWVLQLGPWVRAEGGLANGRSREGGCPPDLVTQENGDCSGNGRDLDKTKDFLGTKGDSVTSTL